MLNFKDESIRNAVVYFLIWKLLVVAGVFFGIYFFETRGSFLGGTLEKHLQNPYFWSRANFDGEHYLRIARYGYQPLTHFYFPLYPFLMHLLTNLLFSSKSLFNLVLVGTVISHVSFFLGLVGFYKLLRLDFSKQQIRLAFLSLILFPTSFYFAMVYTESLFFCLVVWSFYFLRRKKYLLASALGGFSAAVRFVGIAGLFSYIFEVGYKKWNIKKFLALFLFPSGLALYMLYLYLQSGNPLLFTLHGEVFGEYRAKTVLILPQIFYRYIVKIIPNLNFLYFEGTLTPLLELFVGSMLTAMTLLGFGMLRASYFLFLVISFIMPTMVNGFVSLPRYSLIIFPIYIILAMLLSQKNKLIKIVYFAISGALLLIITALFSQGVWIA